MPVLQESDISYRESAPPPAWRAVVSCCWEQHVAVERPHRVLPDGCADILLYASGATEVVGVCDQASTPRLEPGTSIRGIRIRPEAVAATFGVDASSLRNQTLALDDVMGARHSRRIRNRAAQDEWIRSIRPHSRAAVAVRLLRNARVGAVAEAIGTSARQLQRTMLTHVGLTPKDYQRVVRLRRFLTHIEGGDTLAVAAVRAGYSDQAHMSNGISRLSGTTPSALLTERGLTT
jgi:methylphosphotriester-DNA--protein-cysteine methyltransferase